ncbi:hypothetical protein DQ04_13251010 [Trypanosoma grayi]|uniref:hypothetical protein n=1 Tax=Trypanosoma grayi TaxID=71804 RepID=UPI0004F49A80|nr:hypothetical protein DQ04_13251010 [Trypanosoma grayi]KEG06581.1 hypothetical protein DQ04_13251010 [Trypanosoma grayi]
MFVGILKTLLKITMPRAGGTLIAQFRTGPAQHFGYGHGTPTKVLGPSCRCHGQRKNPSGKTRNPSRYHFLSGNQPIVRYVTPLLVHAGTQTIPSDTQHGLHTAMAHQGAPAEAPWHNPAAIHAGDSLSHGGAARSSRGHMPFCRYSTEGKKGFWEHKAMGRASTPLPTTEKN